MQEQIGAGRLKLFEPRLAVHEGHHRRILLLDDVYDWLHPKAPTNRQRQQMAEVRAFLKRFVINEHFDDDDLLKPLEAVNSPPELLYEFRITFQPATRIFGSFFRTGEFVAVLQKSRDRLSKDGFDKSIVVADRKLKWAVPDHPRLSLPRKLLLRECDYD